MLINPWGEPPLYPYRWFRSGRDQWAAIKQVDGLGGEWTFDVFAMRIHNFHVPQIPPVFYELLGDCERLALELAIEVRAEQHGVHQDSLGGRNVSLELFPSVFESQDGHVQLPESSETPVGRHSVQIIGLLDDETFVFRHGWRGWARGDGVGFLPFEYVRRFGTSILTWRRWDRGPRSLEEALEILETAEGSDLHRLWSAPRPRGFTKERGGPYALHWHQTWSLASECPAEVLTLRIPDRQNRPIRAGTAMLLHEDKITSATDLFIWPPYRRRGYGRALVEFAQHRAAAAGAEQLDICVWDADTAVGDPTALRIIREHRINATLSEGSQLVATAHLPLTGRQLPTTDQSGAEVEPRT